VSILDIFSKATQEEEGRFNLLDYAYIGGRYDPDYYISKEDLKILEISIQKLQTLTEELCKKKIESFAAQV
jgi:hypothetical protein